MYRKSIKKSEQKEFENFLLPYGGKLRSDNRWVLLAKEIPWEAIEKKYASQFKENGAPAKSVRIALGSLIIQTRLSLTDVGLSSRYVKMCTCNIFWVITDTVMHSHLIHHYWYIFGSV